MFTLIIFWSSWTFSLNKTVSSAYISKYRLSIFNSFNDDGVKHDGNFSEFFNCNIGLIQGESLLLFLYAMYVNDIEIELINQGCQSYTN
jgi:hypothetical protein